MRIHTQKGFTLIELAIVVAIIGLLMAGAARAYHIYYLNRISETLDNRLDVARKALSDFIVDDPVDANDPDEVRFPCPASPTAAPGDANYGAEERDAGTGLCTATNGVTQVAGTGGRDVFIGALPTRALGIASTYMEDPYGNKLTYAVSHNLAQVNGMAGGGGSGAITIEDESGVITDTGQFVLLSAGKDGAGAYTAAGVANGVGCRVGGQGDAENCDGDAVFRSQAGMTKADVAGFYDDRTVFSLVDETDDEWWEATDNTGQDIHNRNPGNVGIGTADPQNELVVGDNVMGQVAGPDPVVVISSIDEGLGVAGKRGRAFLTLGSGNDDRVQIGWNDEDGANAPTGNFYGEISTPGATPAPLALQPDSGNVGIGTATISPGIELHVRTNDVTGEPGNADIGLETADGFEWSMSAAETTGDWILNRDIPGTSPTIVAKRTGNVGIGTIAPQSKLDVQGEVKIGNTGAACNASNEGATRYNSTKKVMEFCNGTAWKVMGLGDCTFYTKTSSSNTNPVWSCPGGQKMIGASCVSSGGHYENRTGLASVNCYPVGAGTLPVSATYLCCSGP